MTQLACDTWRTESVGLSLFKQYLYISKLWCLFKLCFRSLGGWSAGLGRPSHCSTFCCLSSWRRPVNWSSLCDLLMNTSGPDSRGSQTKDFMKSYLSSDQNMRKIWGEDCIFTFVLKFKFRWLTLFNFLKSLPCHSVNTAHTKRRILFSYWILVQMYTKFT